MQGEIVAVYKMGEIQESGGSLQKWDAFCLPGTPCLWKITAKKNFRFFGRKFVNKLTRKKLQKSPDMVS